MFSRPTSRNVITAMMGRVAQPNRGQKAKGRKVRKHTMKWMVCLH